MVAVSGVLKVQEKFLPNGQAKGRGGFPGGGEGLVHGRDGHLLEEESTGFNASDKVERLIFM